MGYWRRVGAVIRVVDLDETVETMFRVHPTWLAAKNLVRRRRAVGGSRFGPGPIIVRGRRMLGVGADRGARSAARDARVPITACERAACCGGTWRRVAREVSLRPGLDERMSWRVQVRKLEVLAAVGVRAAAGVRANDEGWLSREHPHARAVTMARRAQDMFPRAHSRSRGSRVDGV